MYVDSGSRPSCSNDVVVDVPTWSETGAGADCTAEDLVVVYAGRVRVTPGQTHRVMVDGGGREVSGTLRSLLRMLPWGVAKRSAATTAIRIAVDKTANVSLVARAEVMLSPVRVAPDEGVVLGFVSASGRHGNYVNSLQILQTFEGNSRWCLFSWLVALSGENFDGAGY